MRLDLSAIKLETLQMNPNGFRTISSYRPVVCDEERVASYFKNLKSAINTRANDVVVFLFGNSDNTANAYFMYGNCGADIRELMAAFYKSNSLKTKGYFLEYCRLNEIEYSCLKGLNQADLEKVFIGFRILSAADEYGKNHIGKEKIRVKGSEYYEDDYNLLMYMFFDDRVLTQTTCNRIGQYFNCTPPVTSYEVINRNLRISSRDFYEENVELIPNLSRFINPVAIASSTEILCLPQETGKTKLLN